MFVVFQKVLPRVHVETVAARVYTMLALAVFESETSKVFNPNVMRIGLVCKHHEVDVVILLLCHDAEWVWAFVPPIHVHRVRCA